MERRRPAGPPGSAAAQNAWGRRDASAPKRARADDEPTRRGKRAHKDPARGPYFTKWPFRKIRTGQGVPYFTGGKFLFFVRFVPLWLIEFL